MLNSIMETFQDNIYMLTFLLTLIDHNGIPVPIVTAGAFSLTNSVNPVVLVLIANLSLLATDIIMVYLGKYIKERHKPGVLNFSVFYKFEKKLLLLVQKINMDDKLYVYLMFGKFLPYVGKLLPLFMGLHEKATKFNILLLLTGNMVYVISYYYLGYLFGSILVNYSIMVALIFCMLFIAIYYLAVKLNKRVRT